MRTKNYTVKIKKTNQYLFRKDDTYTFVTHIRPHDNARVLFTEIELKTAGLSAWEELLEKGE